MSAANRRAASILAAASLVAAGVSGCTSDPIVPAQPYQLVFFDSCPDALAGLRAATKASVTPVGLSGHWGGGPVPDLAVDDRAQPPPAAGGDVQSAQQPQRVPQAESKSHSGTNVHEAGVDEPDLVKTDGRRIVTVADGRLSVVDVATRRLVGAVDLRGVDGAPGIAWDADLMLAGDHALLFSGDRVMLDLGTGRGVPVGPGIAEPAVDRPAAADPVVDPIPIPSVPPEQFPIAGTNVLLVDLTGPRILSRARADGHVVDARQVGSTVRLVLRSAPRLAFPTVVEDEAQRLAAYRASVDAAGIDAWAPRLEVTTGDETVRTQVGCDAISHPATYSGANLLTVLSFDATKDALGDGAPVSIVADGDTVYSNGTSLYVASNQGWLMARGVAASASFQSRTEIYRFDITGDRPRYAGGGSVPGQLLNQYAMSEWDGRLRVATTSMGADNETQSGIYVLRGERDRLVGVGSVEGLGKGERIYAVRFVGPIGYVVTFRQTDPLYTVDLSNPSAPVVRGELKIPGYSAYLHPVGETRLIGVGQDATDTGRVLGTQVSLFDVSDLGNPSRVAKYTITGGHSEAEFDPHAFLYWPADGLLVIPLTGTSAAPRGAPTSSSGALVLRVHDDQLSEVGYVTHPAYSFQGWGPTIRRSLVTVEGGDTTLWTVSDGGLQANDAESLARLAWIPL